MPALSDPAFSSNKSAPLHRWVPWIAGFSAEFVSEALERHLRGRTGTVLDPFCGVGTTLIEALLRGHRGVGFEINPYAVLASRTKACAWQVSVPALSRQMRRFREFYAAKLRQGHPPRSEAPAGFRTRGVFYSPKVLRKVLVLHDFVDTLRDEPLRDLFRLAFASTMVSYSNYSYEPSLGRRASAGRADVLDFPVGDALSSKLREMRSDILWLQDRVSKPQAPRVVHDSFFRAGRHLAAASVDLIVTSPPYLNNYHYNRNTRPHLYWLGFAQAPGDMKPLEDSSFGKFWQTVRELDRLDLDFELAGSELPGQLASLRALHPGKGIYGGNGWANYAASYFNDCHRFAREVRRVLKPGATALVVIGNSILQGLPIPTDRYLGEIAEAAGLILVDIHVPRATRVGSSIIQSDVRAAKAEPAQRLYEAVVEIRRAGNAPGRAPQPPTTPPRLRQSPLRMKRTSRSSRQRTRSPSPSPGTRERACSHQRDTAPRADRSSPSPCPEPEPGSCGREAERPARRSSSALPLSISSSAKQPAQASGARRTSRTESRTRAFPGGGTGRGVGIRTRPVA